MTADVPDAAGVGVANARNAKLRMVEQLEVRRYMGRPAGRAMTICVASDQAIEETVTDWLAGPVRLEHVSRSRQPSAIASRLERSGCGLAERTDLLGDDSKCGFRAQIQRSEKFQFAEPSYRAVTDLGFR